MGSLLGAAGFYGDVPGKVAAFREGGEGPDTGGNHAQAAAHKHIPVAHAALLGCVGLHIGDQNPVNQGLRCLQIFGGVDGKLGLIRIQQSAAVLGNDLEELVISNGLPDAVNVIAQGADCFCGGLHVVLRPIIGGIGHTGLVKQILVVDQNNVGKALG